MPSNGQSADLNPTEHAFYLLKTKLKAKCFKNKQGLKKAEVKAWKSITGSGDVNFRQSLTANDLQPNMKY